MTDGAGQTADNAAVFDAPDIVAMFGRAETAFGGDVGEQDALIAAAPTIRETPLLDVGIGGGRTTALLRLMSEQYIGIDIAPHMVERAQEAFPGVDIRVGDARALPVEDDAVHFAMFSFNGIDAVDHADRQRVLSELARVTRPGGLVMYSTLNLHGGSYQEAPWEVRGQTPRQLAYQLLREGSHPVGSARTVAAWRRSRSIGERHETWATGALRAHEYRLLIHFIDVAAIPDELAAVGLEPVAMFPREGGRLDLADLRTDSVYVHVLARHIGG